MKPHFQPYMGYVLLALFGLITIEIIWSWRRQKKVYDVRDSVTNIVIFAGYQLSKFLFAGYTLWFLGLFYQWRIHTFEESVPVFIATFFAVDFCYYWYHRASHVIKFFWAFHLVHHTSQQMNLSVAYRLNWFSFIFSPIFYIPLALIGLPPIFIVGAYALNLLYQFFLHTEAVGKLGVLEKVIDTPSSHRVHHGSNPIYIDKNFGGVLIIWDRVFGTYQAEEEKVKYGITTGFQGYNPVMLVFRGFIDLVRGKMDYKG